MNLTSPPPVEQLDPEYVVELKHHLVRRARKRRSRWMPLLTWVPIAAATAAIAVSTTSVVSLSRGGSTDPAGSTGVIKVPAGESPQVPLDLGPADPAKALAAARRCMTPKTNAYGYPNHLEQPAAANTANYRTARWLSIDNSKRLLQTFTTRDSNTWYQCLDGELLRQGNVVDITLSTKNPLPGTWSWSTTAGGTRASYSFRAYQTVNIVQLRIRGTKTASGWFTTKAEDTSGYVEGTLAGAVAEHGKSEVDVRALDKDGKQVWFKTFG
ncbi:hypothetical protein ACI2LF_10120 [Kribbella sp. NPDC020789]